MSAVDFFAVFSSSCSSCCCWSLFFPPGALPVAVDLFSFPPAVLPSAVDLFSFLSAALPAAVDLYSFPPAAHPATVDLLTFLPTAPAFVDHLCIPFFQLLLSLSSCGLPSLLLFQLIFPGVVWAGAVCEPAPALWRNHRSDECAGAATTAATAASTAATATAAAEETEAQVRVHRWWWWEKCALRQPPQPWSFTGNVKPGFFCSLDILYLFFHYRICCPIALIYISVLFARSYYKVM